MSKKDKIIEDLKTKIFNGIYRTGERLPAEAQLSKDLKVSRSTLRLALNELEHLNLIDRKLGSGTYVKNKNDKKYIIISIPDIFSKNDIFHSFEYTARRLSKIISEMGYKVYVYNQVVNKSFFDLINIKPCEIQGWISISSDNTLPQVEEYKIPIVEVLYLDDLYYNVTINFHNLYNNIYNLLNKYKLDKTLLFLPGNINRKFEEMDFFNEGVIKCFSEKYKTVYLDGAYVNADRENYIIDNLNKYINEVDTIVFGDDTFYKAILTYLIDNINLIKNKKIITHSNYPDDIFYFSNVCRLELNLDDLAEKVWNLLIKIINKEYVGKTTITCDVKVINEDVLN